MNHNFGISIADYLVFTALFKVLQKNQKIFFESRTFHFYIEYI